VYYVGGHVCLFQTGVIDLDRVQCARMCTALLEWVREHAVRAYTTPDSAVPGIVLTLRLNGLDYIVVCSMMHDCS